VAVIAVQSGRCGGEINRWRTRAGVLGAGAVSLRSILLLTLVCLFWALNVVVGRIVVETLHCPPVWYAALRSLVVTLVLVRLILPLPPGWPLVAASAFGISGGSFALLFAGLRDATPSAAAVINLSGAPLTVLFAILILGERVRWRRGIGIALSFAGVGVAVASPSAWHASAGLLLIGASAIVGALASVYIKRIDLAPLRFQAWAGLSSTIGLFPLSLLTERDQIAATLAGGWPLVAAVLFAALVVSLFAHTAYFGILQNHDANLVAPLTLMTPIFTIALGAWITGDHVGAQLLIGAAIAFVGVLVILLRPSRTVFKPLLVRPRL
jgi:O-acetylserine/cysteine efflux transporter